MIISNSRKFIFVHINKTAGTSITQALAPQLAWNDLVLGSSPVGAAMDRPFLERFGLYKHSSAREIRAVVGATIWGEYRSFAVLRDPIDRTVSLYRFLKRIEASRSEFRRMMRGLLGRGRQKWPALYALRETAGFSDFIRQPQLPADPGFVPSTPSSRTRTAGSSSMPCCGSRPSRRTSAGSAASSASASSASATRINRIAATPSRSPTRTRPSCGRVSRGTTPCSTHWYPTGKKQVICSFTREEVTDPIIVVEILSPSNGGIDTSLKLDGYFRLPSLRYYLVVNTGGRVVLHHHRDDTDPYKFGSSTKAS